MTFDALWQSLLPIGRHEETGGYRRYAWTAADLACRRWFTERAGALGLDVTPDRNGNLWAWWGPPGDDAVVTGSHLDSVPDGGAYDGPLGVVSALAAVAALQEKQGNTPRRPVAVVVFADEEGARFGVPCVGSRLLTGALQPDRARSLRDGDGTSLATAMRQAGADPDLMGREDDALGRIGCFVELHVEQGRALADLDAPVGVGTGIWPHGRWRLDVVGAGNHAGTTRLEDRRDPLLTVANTVLAARKKARLAGALATVGKLDVRPGGSNAVPSSVRCWLDARAPEQSTLDALVEDIVRATRERADRDGTSLTVHRESYTPAVAFDPTLSERLQTALGGVPALPTGAGHDAGILAAHVPTAMLFVRNPTGISHDPAEHAEPADCHAGVDALTAVLEDLVCR